jgi:hypothetical protein
MTGIKQIRIDRRRPHMTSQYRPKMGAKKATQKEEQARVEYIERYAHARALELALIPSVIA